MAKLNREEILLLFDVDGTLTEPRSQISSEFEQFIYKYVKPVATIGIVGGADLDKILEQLNGRKILKEFDYIFPENGLVHIENGKVISKQSIQHHLGEEVLIKFINFVLEYISKLDLPFKRGTFIEFRNGMLNICPVGRQCSLEERKLFHDYDKKYNIRNEMIDILKKEFNNVDLTYSIGGQISFDVFPYGWDKSYCLNHIYKSHKFQEIHFFGDKTEPGENDYEIYNNNNVIGHKVHSPADTKEILIKLFCL